MTQNTHDLDDMNTFIDTYRDNLNQSPESDSQQFTAQLMDLADGLDMDTEIDEQLKGQFSTTPKRQNRVLRLPLIARRVVAAVFVIIFASLLTMLVFPDVRTFAQEVLDSLFGRSETTRRTFEAVDYDPDDIIRYGTIEGLEEVAGFDVRVPTAIPEGYTLTTQMFVGPRNTAILTYNAEEVYGHFNIQQQPIEDSETIGVFWYDADQDVIGPRTKIEQVMIGELTAEFVRGAWVTGQPSNDGAVYEWNNLIPAYTLRWKDDTMFYELRMVMDFKDFDMEEFIAIAESMMD